VFLSTLLQQHKNSNGALISGGGQGWQGGAQVWQGGAQG
jgi:hypothetical protein